MISIHHRSFKSISLVRGVCAQPQRFNLKQSHSLYSLPRELKQLGRSGHSRTHQHIAINNSAPRRRETRSLKPQNELYFPTQFTMSTRTKTVSPQNDITLHLSSEDNDVRAPPQLPFSIHHLEKLTREQAGHIRHFHNLASQIDGNWNHMGAQEPGQVLPPLEIN
jgi:hypothetical protein